jgi:hypothetical protein
MTRARARARLPIRAGSNDTFLAFVLRAVEFVLADHFRADREIIDYLWDVLDDPQLNKALGLPQNSQMTFRRSRF